MCKKNLIPIFEIKQNKKIVWKKKLYDCLAGVPASFLKNTLRKSKGKNHDTELDSIFKWLDLHNNLWSL